VYLYGSWRGLPQNELKLGDNTLHFKSETPHLGLIRSSSDENRINIEERIALARRTLYSLIKTGVGYTAEFAVLIGRDCRRFSVPIWKLERVAISFFLRISVSRPYSNLGIT
jgi:hypothetical protein